MPNAEFILSYFLTARNFYLIFGAERATKLWAYLRSESADLDVTISCRIALLTMRTLIRLLDDLLNTSAGLILTQ